MNNIKAILILGPTGSGKTPLGAICEKKGLWGANCFHFDFGLQLRCIAEIGEVTEFFTDKDINFIKQTLETEALLENEKFYIAEKILFSFLKNRQFAKKDLLILNGLPRHIDQAKEIDKTVNIIKVVQLECSPEVVVKRINMNSGGDRTGRTDDSLKKVENKLKIFKFRTLPVIEHYNKIGVEKINVSINITAEKIYSIIEKKSNVSADRELLP